MTEGITISQAAAYAGVTVKTIRHYHQNGLVDEPGRDRSGYRRYGSADLLRLVQVRTLAGAGVPLAEIGEILDADPDRFAAALVDVERRLDERIDELLARRDTLRRLSSGDRVLLPERACALLDRLPGLGFTEDNITMTREALVLVRALAPESFEDYVAQVERNLDDPAQVEFAMRWSAAGDWDPGDPRVEELANAWADHLIANPSLVTVLPGLQNREDAATRSELLNHHAEENKPAWTRITELMHARLHAAGIEVS